LTKVSILNAKMAAIFVNRGEFKIISINDGRIPDSKRESEKAFQVEEIGKAQLTKRPDFALY